MNKKLHVLVLSLFIVSVLFFSAAALSDVETNTTIRIDDSSVLSSDYVPREIRVAIYDEPNMTAPSYATMPGGINNNATKNIVGGGYRFALCPRCHSTDRERLVYWYIVHKTNILHSQKTIKCIYHHLLI